MIASLAGTAGICGMLDPNWFYSTLAQSAAAITGVLGGFLFQGLLTQRRDIAQLRNTIRSRFKDAVEALEAELSIVDGVVESLGRILGHALDAREAGDEHVDIGLGIAAVLAPPRPGGSNSVSTKGLVVPLPVDAVSDLESAHEAVLEYRSSIQVDLPTYADEVRCLGGLSAPADSRWLDEEAPGDTPPMPGDFLGLLPHQKEIARLRWQAFRDRSVEDGLALSDFRSKLVPPSLYGLLVILAAMLFVGVIAPMLYLSARSDGSRSALLFAFTPLAAVLVVYLGFEIAKLRRADRLASERF